jgi:ferredoxin
LRATNPRFGLIKTDPKGSAITSDRKRPRWAPGGGDGLTKRIDAASVELSQRDDLALDMLAEETIPGNGRTYRVVFENGVGLRTGPSVGDPRTGMDLEFGEVFTIKTEVKRGNRSYFELIDGRGWAFDWADIEGQRWQLVELAAQLYTVRFPNGVVGLQWQSDTTQRFTKIHAFNDGDTSSLVKAGLRPGDTVVMIDDNPIVGMPFPKVLERMWATGGRQPGNGQFYRVCTKGAYGIGVRESADIKAPRTGADLIRGEVFEVDEIMFPGDYDHPGPEGSKIIYLHLSDNRGWVFDTQDEENPSVIKLEDIEPGATLTMWRGSDEDLLKTLGLKFKQDNEGEDFQITVLEEGKPPTLIPAKPGSNLRRNLMDNGFQVYGNFRASFHCNARQLCGTCVLDVMEGEENITVKSINEKEAMKRNPSGYRLCCNIDVYGDCTVRLRPKDVIYGGGTS